MILEILKSLFGFGAKPKPKFGPAKEGLTTVDLGRGIKNKTAAAHMQEKHRAGRLETIKRLRDAGYDLFSLQASDDERDCPWCKVNSGKKFTIDTDINKLIQENCTCEYCRCWIRPQRH